MTLALRTVAALIVAVLPHLVTAQDFEKFSVENSGGQAISQVGYYVALDDDAPRPQAKSTRNASFGLRQPAYASMSDDSESYPVARVSGESVLRAPVPTIQAQPQPISSPVPTLPVGENFQPLIGSSAPMSSELMMTSDPATYGALPTFSSGNAVACDGDGACGGGCSKCRLFHLPKSPLACGDLCSRACPDCCGVGTHYSSVYGGFLYLRARNADVAYGEPIDGPITALPANNPIQVGSLGVVDAEYQPGYFAGINFALDTVSSIDARFTRWDGESDDGISTSAPDVIRSLVAHPSSTSAATDFLSATASLDIAFDQLDVAYRHLLVCRDVFAANYVVGGRYAQLSQQFNSVFVNNGTETVTTDIDFAGAGIKVGLETDSFSCRNRLHLYTRSYASFLAGRTRANYFQGQSFDPTVVNTDWEAGRVVPVLDLEVGLGWTSATGRVRLSGGYLVSAWFNTVKTEEFIQAVQNSDFLNLGDTLTFDGLAARAEYRF